MKTAFITGITGQDGAYLCALLLEKNYRVFGGYRRASTQTFWRLAELGRLHHPNLTLIEHDLTDFASSLHAITTAQPDEIYNLGAQSYVGVSFKQPAATAKINAIGCLELLEAVRAINPSIRVYQASSAEMFGKVQSTPQNEQTAFHPRSPYAISKLSAHWTAVNFREAYGMFVSCGILFNHESPLRGPEFVTRKISLGAARIRLGLQSSLQLGNLDAKRDWGFAGEFVEGMWRMLQADAPENFVLATGVETSVRGFAAAAFQAAGIDLEWTQTDGTESARCIATGNIVITTDPTLRRPAEVETLRGDASRAITTLGWKPVTTVNSLAAMMVQADLARESSTGGSPQTLSSLPT